VAATDFKNFQELGADPSARCAAALEAIGEKGYDALRAAHVADHRALFRRVRLDLGRTDRAVWPTDRRQAQITADAKLLPASAEEARSSSPPPDAGLRSDPALAALHFQYGRYMLIASSRP